MGRCGRTVARRTVGVGEGRLGWGKDAWGGGRTVGVGEGRLGWGKDAWGGGRTLEVGQGRFKKGCLTTSL